MATKKKPNSIRAAEYCGNCRFFLANEESGLCRRYPPRVVTDEDAAFTVYPVVDSTEWCGEHQGPKQ